MIREEDLRAMIIASQTHGRVDDDLASAVMEIANGIATLRNFAGYSQIEDMVSEGVLAMLRAIPNVDLDRASNPHSYLSRVCFNSFRTSIKRNKRHHLPGLPVGGAAPAVDDVEIPYPVEKISKVAEMPNVAPNTIGLYRNRDGKVVAVMTYETMWDLLREP